MLGLLQADGEFIAGPAAETPLQSGDRLMIFGVESEIQEIAHRLERTAEAPAGPTSAGGSG